MNQLKRNSSCRLMYIENKQGDIDGYAARIGWVTFSRSGRSIYYRGRLLKRLKGGGISGNYYCGETGQEYWVSGVKKRGSNVHWAKPIAVHIDEDAAEAYRTVKSSWRHPMR